MKKIRFYFFLLLTVFAFTVTSCKKEDSEKDEDNTENTDENENTDESDEETDESEEETDNSQEEEETEDDGENTSNAPISAMVDGTLFEASSNYIFTETYDNGMVDIYGASATNFENMMSLVIAVGTNPGTYDLTVDNENDFYAVYHANNDEIYTTETENSTGTLTIESISFDSEDKLTQLTATFSFVAHDEAVFPAESITITQGKIDYN